MAWLLLAAAVTGATAAVAAFEAGAITLLSFAATSHASRTTTAIYFLAQGLHFI